MLRFSVRGWRLEPLDGMFLHLYWRQTYSWCLHWPWHLTLEHCHCALQGAIPVVSVILNFTYLQNCFVTACLSLLVSLYSFCSISQALECFSQALETVTWNWEWTVKNLVWSFLAWLFCHLLWVLSLLLRVSFNNILTNHNTVNIVKNIGRTYKYRFQFVCCVTIVYM